MEPSRGTLPPRPGKPYQLPVLIVYGNVTEITRAVATFGMMDGGTGSQTMTG